MYIKNEYEIYMKLPLYMKSNNLIIPLYDILVNCLVSAELIKKECPVGSFQVI